MVKHYLCTRISLAMIVACLATGLTVASCDRIEDSDDTFGIYSTSPVDGAEGVATNAVIITFLSDVDPSTLTSSTFQVRVQGGGAVPGLIGLAGVTADFRPTDGTSDPPVYVEFAPNTTYVVTLGAEIKGTNGISLGTDYT
ncbi:MAG TPA: Ig-like domain-containing protein, partial [Deltaproteobacteria bacterium]|nr:Ig-like domain-containing protein [Deltaproteobacteria bacterium]